MSLIAHSKVMQLLDDGLLGLAGKAWLQMCVVSHHDMQTVVIFFTVEHHAPTAFNADNCSESTYAWLGPAVPGYSC